jgi:two-component system cell cycle response regulator
VAHLRSNEATRAKPVLGIVPAEERKTMLKALELEVNDVIFRPVDSLELLARARTQIKRKRFVDFLKNSLDRSLEMAVTDALTGLNNRRFMDHHLSMIMAGHLKGGPAVSVLVLDLDYFKKVNDVCGHDAGDEVLKEFARRLGHNVRAIDLPCRMGGEEFVVLMPETDSENAMTIAERVRVRVAADPFVLADGRALSITVSVGVATSNGYGDSAEALLKRADAGLYEAKNAGRNQVVLHNAA